ncbi:MAG: glycine zipper family protein [Paracoccaceae bacterium]
MTLKPVFFALFATALAACGEPPVQRALVVDGTRTPTFEADRQHCSKLAMSYDGKTARDEALTGAAIGGLLGLATGSTDSALIGAGLGGAIGGVEGNATLNDTQRDLLVRCMQNRGHNVLG